MIFAALDIEATGLINPDLSDPNYQPGIVEFGAIRWAESDRGLEVAPRELILRINPEMNISKGATEVHGITDEHVSKELTFKGAFSKIAEFFTGVGTLITFNGKAYDMPVIMFNLQRYNLQYQFPWPRIHIDVMHSSADYVGLQGKTSNKVPKLTELYKFLFDKELEGAHNAYEDAKATKECYQELRNRRVI